MGPMFFFCSVTVVFISVLQLIVSEKELKLRHAMEMMGLKPSIYWLTLFLNQSVLVFIAALMTCILGLLCQFTVFTQTDFSVTLLLFFLFGLAMVAFGFFITVFCRTTRAATMTGMLMLIFGLMFESFAFSSSFIGYIFFSSSTNRAFYLVLMHLPFFNFGKFFLDLSLFTTGKFDPLTQTSVAGPGFPFSNLYSDIPASYIPNYDNAVVTVPQPYVSFLLFLMNIAIYITLTLYFDRIIPDVYGKRDPIYFFLLPSFWFGSKNENAELDQFINSNQPLGSKPEFREENEDVDVAAERRITFDKSINKAVRIGNLRKEYHRFPCINWKTDKVAVKSLCLTLEEGKLLALLGQNGAGKSTTMSCLSGLTPATDGDALVYGYSIRKHMNSIRTFLGICPQHDILFNEMTAMEHLQLYGGLKNLSQAEISIIAEERLKAVKLWKVKDQFAGTYSGGMKRRLSVVISTIGDPKIIFLDEPTTGMDPVNRRHVWTFLERFKENRIMVLTTHSMEEADVLGDQIAVMARGKLRALGSGVTLKSRYGEGYKIGLTILPVNIEKGKMCIAQIVPEAVLEDDSAGSLIYRVPPTFLNKVPALVRFLESNSGKSLFESWGLSQTSLEEVFLRLIRDAPK
ncbi:hypothetical protein HMI54_006371 [Coelomomyces lativittatus]|nr:hypothetical protein HMI54_006371 [Coelomomyces lativittatus]